MSLKSYVSGYNKHFGNNVPKFMILAAILFLCKLEGQDVKINFGIRYFWTQHTQIDLISHRYRFYLNLHLTSFSRPLSHKFT